MSFIIAVHVNEGIVLASDRRTTYTNTEKNSDGTIVKRIGIHTTDSTDKTFICPNGAGISTCGDATLNRKPISGYIKAMIRENVFADTDLEAIPDIIIDYFKQFPANLNTSFLVAGYSKKEDSTNGQIIYDVNLSTNRKTVIDTTKQGATWAGETYTLIRLVTDVAQKNQDGSYIDLPYENILWEYFTLQDAVDFARYAVETTINTMRFKNVVETVGGAVDILLITPEDTKWLQKATIK